MAFKGQNSVDVDVTVKATVAKGAKDIALVASESALKDAKAPALLMTLKVGADEKVITVDGAEAAAKIEGVPSNFTVDVESNAYVYKIKDDADPDTWKSTTVQLSGKTNQMNVPTGDDTLNIPQITLTWTIAKHENVADADADAAIKSVTEFDKAAPADVVIAFDLGSGENAIDADGVSLTFGANKAVVNASKYTVDMSAKTVTIDKATPFLTKATEDIPIYVSLTKGGTVVKELAGTIVIK